MTSLVSGLAGVLESDFFSEEHQSNPKHRSSVLDATRGAQQLRAHMRQHFESSPKAFCTYTFIICAPKSLSPVELSKTSVQGSLYPLHLQESDRNYVSDAGKSNSACTVLLN